MGPKEITSCSNGLIKSVCRLLTRKERDFEDAFLIEGTKLFREALAWKVTITDVFYTQRWLERAMDEDYERLMSLSRTAIPCYVVNEAVMSKLSSQKHPEGMVCRCKKLKKESHFPSTYVILDDVQDPGNVGTIIRTADAAGFGGIQLSSKTADVYNDKVLRSTMGSIFHLPTQSVKDLYATLDDLKEQGYFIIGTALDGEEALPQNLIAQNKIALILGNESRGMSQKAQDRCDFLYRLPMFGHAESLNVSVAGGIVMYDIARKIKK